MRERKYTLPRHTNLANQGPRIAAFLIDLSIALAITLGFVFGVFRWVFNGKTKPLEEKIEKQRLDTALFFKDEDGALNWYSTDSDNKEFVDALAYFYTVYIPQVDSGADEPLKLIDGTTVNRKDYFTVKWFNETILAVEGDGRAYFEYEKVGEEDNKDVLAKIKTDALNENVNSYLQKQWVSANYQLNRLPSFMKINDEYGFYNSLEFVLSALIAISNTYIVFPIIFKNGVTVGKKVVGLGLASSDGYKMRNYQLGLRIIPPAVILLTLLIPMWNSLLTVMIVGSVVLLTSFTFVMASPKRCALHDFVARTIVVDLRTSTLFDNGAEEEAFIAKEDGLETEEVIE